MDGQKNGAADIIEGGPEEELPSLPPEQEQPQNAAQQAFTAAQLVEAQVAQVVGVVVRGLIVSSQQIPAALLLPAIARSTGRLLAMSIVNNPVEITVKTRKEFREAFEDGMSKVSILAPAGPGVASSPLTKHG